MEESIWESLDTSDIVDTILTPTTSPSSTNHQFKIPQIECTISNHKLNPYINSQYLQLLNTIMSTNFKPLQTSKRFTFHAWLSQIIDTDDPRCSVFLNNSTKKLAKLKNKRQLVSLLKKSFSKIHKQNNQCKQTSQTSPFLSYIILLINVLAYITLFLLLTSALFLIIFLNTNYIESIYFQSKYLPALKALKAVIVALWQ